MSLSLSYSNTFKQQPSLDYFFSLGLNSDTGDYESDLGRGAIQTHLESGLSYYAKRNSLHVQLRHTLVHATESKAELQNFSSLTLSYELSLAKRHLLGINYDWLQSNYADGDDLQLLTGFYQYRFNQHWQTGIYITSYLDAEYQPEREWELSLTHHL